MSASEQWARRGLRGMAVCACLLAGAAYGQVTNEDQKVVSSDIDATDQFGRSVSVDGTRAVVGAAGYDVAGQARGGVYVLEHNGSAWVETATLTASDGAADDMFGIAVSLDGDRIAVGASGDDDGGALSGSVYIFDYNGSAWVETAKLTASDAASFEQFGEHLSLDGDRLVIGAQQGVSGSAYVFDYNGSAWVETVKLTASDAATGDSFGASVALEGDRAVVGARFDDDVNLNAGSAYVFDYNGSAWVESAKLVASDAGFDNNFGFAVSLYGDRLAVGAYKDDDSGSASGSAYVFDYNGSAWVESAKLTASDGAANDWFGSEIALEGSRVVIGAERDDEAGSDSGSAYVFEFNGSAWVEAEKLAASDGAANDWFGSAVALDGDRALIGAYGHDGGGTDAGAAYSFAFSSIGSVAVSAPDLTATYNAAASVPIALGNAEGVISAEVFVEYDTNLLTLSGVSSTGTLSDGWSVESNTEAGAGALETVKIALATDQSAAIGAVTLVDINFTVADIRVPSSSALTLTHVLLNDGNPAFVATDGSITLVGTDAAGSTDVATVAPGGNITVTITDADEDLDGSGSSDQVAVAVSNGAQTETLTLNETATPGQFSGTIGTVFSASSTSAAHSGDNTVQAKAGDQIGFSFSDQLKADGTAGTLVLAPVNVIGGADGTAAITDATQPGDAIYISVADADLNGDNGVAETVVVTVTSSNGESEAVTLTEVDVDDDVFFGSLASAAGASAGTDDDGTINAQKGDVLTLTYADALTVQGGQANVQDTDQVVDPFGDADGNGNVQAFDAAQTLLHVLAPFLTGLELIQANVDTDPAGTGVTPFDASLILQRRVGLISVFPVQQAASTNHPQNTPASPKGIAGTRYLALSYEDGYLSLSADERGGILSGDVTLKGIDGKVVMGDELGQFIQVARATDEGLRIVFAGAEGVQGAGELLRVYPTAAPERVELERATLNDGRIAALGRDLAVGLSPLSFALHANAPNPFNPATQIRFDLPVAGQVELAVYDMLGQKVRTLVASSLAAGSHVAEWNGRDQRGAQAASGVYFYRLEAGDFTQMRRMMLLK